MPTDSQHSPSPTTKTTLTFINDPLERKLFSSRLERYLKVESDFVEGSVVAAINAPFGSGKTTFIEMWKEDLIKRRDSQNSQEAFEAPMPVILNAWESDFCGDPLAAILSALLKAVDNWHGKALDPEKVHNFKEALKSASWILAGIGNGFASKLTGVNAMESLKIRDEKRKERTPDIPDFIKLFDQRQNALRDLRKALEAAFAGSTPKMLVFVDELDRCRPDYAIHYLETIKHVFNVKGMVFLLAIDAAQLEVSARALFGDDLNFSEYFRKFCHRKFNLPEPEEEPTGKLLRHYVQKFVIKEGVRNSAFKEGEYIARMVAPLVRNWSMTARQLAESFRILGHALAISGPHGEKRTHNPTISLAYLYLSLLKVANPSLYDLYSRGLTNHADIIKSFRKTLSDKEDARSWIKIYSAGVGNHAVLGIRQILKEQGLITQDSDLLYRDFMKQTGENLSHFPQPFVQICQRLEHALGFEDAWEL